MEYSYSSLLKVQLQTRIVSLVLVMFLLASLQPVHADGDLVPDSFIALRLPVLPTRLPVPRKQHDWLRQREGLHSQKTTGVTHRATPVVLDMSDLSFANGYLYINRLMDFFGVFSKGSSFSSISDTCE